jgi:aspartokinase-like uncharacterized kinase
MSQPRALRVVKVGGSLLDLDDLADRLRRWLAEEGENSTLLVVGGGCRADLLRTHRQQLNDVEAHWLAIDAMLANARTLKEQLPEATWLDRIGDVKASGVPLSILNPVSFMQHDDPHHPFGALPANWNVTSDSIAARAAELAGVDELIVLKSAPPPAPEKLEELVTAGYVDDFFPTAARNVARVRFVNFRDVCN